ncbi:GNAT family N-acetyltransferase [Janibacter sp. YB324]|uniref:GNAT family N-acetyltransferase n=1 Tax=Janibacter sp. YB324 TaxID=2761047 RepID=UPI001628B132|nr:GNAT family N-acetyltransferase [Janibacter sp. YB324]QNF94391.1 GNAT family N-acetyltransferase [Janibacter sp. YB324]
MSDFAMITPVGRVTIEPVVPAEHIELLHAWVTHPRSAFWGMQGFTLEQSRAAFDEIDADPHHAAWLGRVDGVPTFLTETYDPVHSVLATHYRVEPGQLGMHVLVAPTDAPVHGMTSQVFRAVMHFCFRDPSVTEVVVEPDVRNQAIHAKNAAAGFVVDRRITLSDKEALLSFCTLEAFAGSELERGGERLPSPDVAHLEPEVMARAHRHVAAKAIGELTHERVIAPEPTADGRWTIAAGAATYTFAATRHALEHWRVDPASIERTVGGRVTEVDALGVVSDLHEVLGIPDHLRSTYLEELSGTLASLAHKWHHARHTSRDLVDADFQTIESAMTEGHPAFIANNGRIGFSATDHATYSPEAAADVRLEWIAVRRNVAHLSLAEGMTEEDLYAGELDPADRERFSLRLEMLGLDPADYLLMPVHPWQWDHKLAVTFAADIARRDVVHLGHTRDRYRAQQSIRTFFNTDRPERHYVKTALAIQNMGFLRGLSPKYMEATPAINDWVADVVAGDPELADCGFRVLREVAAIGYTGDAYHRLGVPNPHTKIVAALWRESPVPKLAAGQRIQSLTGLLHRDAEGAALITELIAASPIGAREWVRRMLRAYLRPVVHCLGVHDLAFMPHGENLILVLEDHVPTGVFMKDIGEEVVVMSDRELPPEVERIRHVLDPQVQSLSVLTDVIDGVLRFVAEILADDEVLNGEDFWALVAECIAEHAADHPRAARLDLLRESFEHSCLNRLQLRNTLQMVDLTDPEGSLIRVGDLANPLHAHCPTAMHSLDVEGLHCRRAMQSSGAGEGGVAG